MTDASEQNISKEITKAVLRILDDCAIAALATLVDGPRGVGAKVLIDEAGVRVGSTGDATLDAQLVRHAPSFLASRAQARTYIVEEFAGELDAWRNTHVLFERIEAEHRVVVCGAGHVGASLARLAHAIGYRVTLIDDRADFVTRTLFPEEGIELITAENWTIPVRKAVGNGRGVSVAIVTRGHSQDEECLHAVFQSRPDYVGMIGSKRRTNIVLERLREAGVDESLLRGVHAPVGLDIAAVTPEEVALAILAEIVAERRGGAGTSLSAWRRK